KDGGAWTSIGAGIAATSQSISNLGNGSYTYRLTACNSFLCSNPSPASLPVTVLFPPTVPGSINVSPATSYSGSVTVSWGSVAAAVTTYELEQQQSGGGWSTVFTANATTALRSGLSNGIYAFRVRACNGSECGSYSPFATAEVLLPPLAPT